MANYLVTGGAGFIGSNIVEYLLSQGATVRVVDNFATGKRENIAPFLDSIDLVEGSICEDEICRRACDGIDYVLHQAAIPSVPRSIAEPVSTTFNNVLGTVQMLNAATSAKVRRFVYAASSSAYGDQDIPAKVESLLPRPLSPYAAAKLSGEYFCRAYAATMGLETVALRYFNVFGPRQDPTSQYSAVIPKFITAALEGQQPVIYGDGTQSRDFTFVWNNVRANVLAAHSTKPVAGLMMNIACGASYTLLDLIAGINAALGSEITPIFAERRSGDVLHSLADITRARDLIGYEVEIDFHEGLRQVIEWYRINAAPSCQR
jgi:nucleoside-diphosphate-sugar epimerase